MPAALIATLPRNGQALLAAVRDAFSAMFASRNNTVATTPAAVQDMSVWQLYRMTVGYDSITPKVAAELRGKLVGE